MLSPGENKKKNIPKCGMLKILHRSIAYLIDVCKKFNTCQIKGTGLYDLLFKHYKMFFLTVVDLLYIKIS